MRFWRDLWGDPSKRFALFFLMAFGMGMTVIAFNGYYADYLIAPGWSMVVRPIGWLVAVGAATVVLYLAGNRKGHLLLGLKHPTWGEVIPAMLVTAFLSFYAVVGFIPLLSALLLRQEVQISYTVANVGNDGNYGGPRFSRRCYSTIEFEHLPALVGMICFAPYQVHTKARPGDTIILSGRGSPLGVFYDQVELIRQP